MTEIATQVQGIRERFGRRVMIVEGLFHDVRHLIRMIEFYSNSKYLNGQRDELGREKPFYNIGNGMCDVENAAKDIDTKDVTATSDDGEHYTESMLMSTDIYEWMKAVGFGKVLNEMRDTHTRYGSLLVKKCISYDKDGKRQLTIEIPEWKNVIFDPVNILGSPIIEVHYLSATDLLDRMEMGWDKKRCRAVIEQLAKAGPGARCPIYEVRGNFPRAFMKEMSGSKVVAYDRTKFSYQLYYFAGEYTENQNQTATNRNFSDKLDALYWEDDTEKVYKYCARKRKAGRDFGVGVIEEGEEAQVWTNDAVLKQFRAMEFTSKVIGQTSTKKLKGRNVLTEVDDGIILETDANAPITTVNLLPAGGLTQYANLINQWYDQFEKVTSGYAAQRGEVPPSGTPFRLQATILQQSSSVFGDLQEELGLFVTEIFNDWIMPYLAKQLNTEHILAHNFSPEELKEIDRNFSNYHATQLANAAILSGKIMTPEQYDAAKEMATQVIQATKGQRFLQVPKDYYKQFKAKITVNVTGEQRNKGATLESLANIMKTYASNPSAINDPVLTQIMFRIVELSGAGISPVTLISALQERAKMQEAAAKNAAAPEHKVSESINFKDLPGPGKVQMAKQAGIDISTPAPQPVSPAPVTAAPVAQPAQ